MLDSLPLQAVAHAVGLAEHLIRGAQEGLNPGGREAVCLRAQHHAQNRRAAGIDARRHGCAAGIDGKGRARTEKAERIALAQLAALQTAHAGGQVRGAAAHRQRHVQSAAERQIGAEAAPSSIEGEHLSAMHAQRTIAGDGHAVQTRPKVAAGDCDVVVLGKLDGRAGQRQLQPSGARVVAHQQLRQRVRVGICRAGHRYAHALHAVAPRVLHRGHGTVREDANAAHVTRPPFARRSRSFRPAPPLQSDGTPPG